MGERVKLKRQDRMVAWVLFKIRQIGEDEISKFACLLYVKSLRLNGSSFYKTLCQEIFF